MADPLIIATLIDGTSRDQAEDALARLDAARALLASVPRLWRLLPTRWQNSQTIGATKATRTESMMTSRTTRAVLDTVVADFGMGTACAVTAAVPLPGATLRIQHRGRTTIETHPELPRVTIDAVRAVLDHATEVLTAALHPEAPLRMDALPARFSDHAHVAAEVEMPTRWNPARMLCSCGSEHVDGIPVLPHAYDVFVKEHEGFGVFEIATRTTILPTRHGNAVSRLRAEAALARIAHEERP